MAFLSQPYIPLSSKKFDVDDIVVEIPFIHIVEYVRDCVVLYVVAVSRRLRISFVGKLKILWAPHWSDCSTAMPTWFYHFFAHLHIICCRETEKNECYTQIQRPKRTMILRQIERRYGLWVRKRTLHISTHMHTQTASGHTDHWEKIFGKFNL